MAKGCPALLWVCDGSLTARLDRATWLETAAELHRLGWHVRLAAADTGADEVDDQVEAIRVPWPRVYLIGYLIFYIALFGWFLFKGGDIDVVLLHEDGWPLLLLKPACWLLRRRIPKMVMDSRSMPMSTVTVRETARALLFVLAHRAANRWADGQTAITRRLALAIGTPERQLLGTWPSGVNAARFAFARSDRHWPGPEDPLRLIYVGSLHCERRLLPLCEAVQMVRREGVPVILELLGDGPQMAELADYARERGLGAIVVDGPVPHADVPGRLAGAHVGVLPFPAELKFEVSSPIKLFEYMAAGMPVLATRIVCHTDVLGDEDCVFWAQDASPAGLAAAIHTACIRKAELRQMGQRAQAAVQAWTWTESAKKLAAALYKSCGSGDCRSLGVGPGHSEVSSRWPGHASSSDAASGAGSGVQ